MSSSASAHDGYCQGILEELQKGRKEMQEMLVTLIDKLAERNGGSSPYSSSSPSSPAPKRSCLEDRRKVALAAMQNHPEYKYMLKHFHGRALGDLNIDDYKEASYCSMSISQKSPLFKFLMNRYPWVTDDGLELMLQQYINNRNTELRLQNNPEAKEARLKKLAEYSHKYRQRKKAAALKLDKATDATLGKPAAGTL